MASRSSIEPHQHRKYSRDIFYVNLDGSDRTPKPLVVSPHQDMMPRLSPDGRWMAYQSDESGQFEIYVRPFPGTGARVQVSTLGGWEPIWSRDGRTLFYKTPGRIMAVSVRTSPTFSMGNRTVALVGDFVPNPTHANWDVAPDGKHLAHTIEGMNLRVDLKSKQLVPAGPVPAAPSAALSAESDARHLCAVQ